jgi:hypothetical protein
LSAVLIFWNVHDGPHLLQIEMHKSSPPLVGCMGDLLGWWMLNRSILGIGFVDLALFESKPSNQSNQNQEQFVFSIRLWARLVQPLLNSFDFDEMTRSCVPSHGTVPPHVSPSFRSSGVSEYRLR